MMRLLLFSDVHNRQAAIRDLGQIAQSVDVVVGAGDFANGGIGLKNAIRGFAPVTKPSVIIPGNNETFEALREACELWPSARVLHGETAEVAGLTFFGLGGAVQDQAGHHQLQIREEQASELLAACPAGAILVVHHPPFGAVDRQRMKHSGSTAVRAAVDRLKPRLVVCGHIHTQNGLVEWLDDVPVVNAGPNGIVWDVEQQRRL
jgi:Icc-related predicted phosphoesterase